MSIFRVNSNKDYTVMNNYHLKDKGVSLKAKGLLSVMLSLPDNWDYSIQGLVAICKESKNTIVSVLDELKKLGYLKVTKTTDSLGRFDYIYDIYEKPYPQPKKPDMDKPAMVTPSMDFSPQLNTNKSITKELNTNNKEIYKERRFVKPILEEVKEYCLERQNNIDPQTFIDFYESKGWKVGNSPMKDWKACVRTWEKRNTKTRVEFKGIEEHQQVEINKSAIDDELAKILKR